MFMFAFNCLIAKLKPSTSDQEIPGAARGDLPRTPPATSGTYRAADGQDEAVPELAAQTRLKWR
jgi:hypothetical protein